MAGVGGKAEPERQARAASAGSPPVNGGPAATPDALSRENALLVNILNSMSAGLVVAQTDGRFLLVNPAAEQIVGFGATDVPLPQWSERYGCYQADRATLVDPQQLPLARALRGEEVPEENLFIRNHRRLEGVWIRVTARPLRDEHGQVQGGLAIFRDITEEMAAERRLAAQHAVTRVLAEAATLQEATPQILEAIGTSVDWEVGALWCVDRARRELHCIDVWHRDGSLCSEFIASTRNSTFTGGVGLPGRVWASGEPAWIADILKDSNFPRATAAAREELHGAFAFPILFGNEVTGVVEFFSREIRKPDHLLLSMMNAMGSQLGQFIERKHTEEALRQSRERFELAMQGSGDGLWDWDVVSNVVYFSPRWKSMLGYEDAEIRNDFDEWVRLLHPEDRDRALTTAWDYVDGKIPTYEVEHRLRHKDGTYRWILARGVALRDGRGRAYRMAGSHTDITERKRSVEALRDSEALYHSLVETLPRMNVFRKDRHGRFTFVNRHFCKTVGKPAEELLGKTDYDFYPPALAEKYREDDRRVLEERMTLDVVEENRTPDGKPIYVQVLKTPVYDARGAVVGTQAIFWDVTDRKLAEEEMHKAKEAAESANKAKSAFLANMSHEIRTPMNAIIGMTELVLETELTAEQREYLDLVKKSADSLLAVINDILDFSKVEAGKLDLDAVGFALRDHLGDTLNTLAPRAYRKGLELACHVAADVPDHLVGDPVRLGQVVVNLVGNALKFTERGEVVVDVEATSRAAHEVWLHFAVSDTGIGVPQDKREYIFDAFAQADGSTTRKYGGTGLGLAIAKRLVEMMGGRIWVESELGRGSTFHFTARFDIQTAVCPAPEPPEAARVTGLAVLVVDDNATNRRILDETLRHWGMRPTLTESAPAALDALRQAVASGEPFPLVLIDYHMPDIDGCTLATQIKQDPDMAGATLIMLTSGNQPGDAARRREIGISLSLTKPIKQADLWRAIMHALGMPLASDETIDAPASTEAGGIRRRRVLLAEDNLVNQKLAVRLLERRGHEVVVVNNGREALAALRARPYDVVLMDVQMPEMDGYEATAAIRRQEQQTGGHVPIIAMTAYAMKGDRERCLAEGMDGYLAKPIRAQELFAKVEGCPVVTPLESLRSSPVPESAWDGVIDLGLALSRVGQDADLLRELAEIFLQECPRLLGQLGQAVEARDAAAVKAAAHSLKGAIDNFAAKPAFEAALHLERLGRTNDLTGVEDAWAELQRQVSRLRGVLEAFTGQVTSA